MKAVGVSVSDRLVDHATAQDKSLIGIQNKGLAGGYCPLGEFELERVRRVQGGVAASLRVPLTSWCGPSGRLIRSEEGKPRLMVCLIFPASYAVSPL